MTRQRRLPLQIKDDPEIVRLQALKAREEKEGNFGRADRLQERIYKRRHDALRAKFGRKTKRRKRAA